MLFTDIEPLITACRSLFMMVRVFEKFGKPHPCANGPAARNAPRPPTALTSVRDGKARPFDIQSVIPALPVSQLRSVQAAALCCESLAIEYDTVNPRLPFTLPLTIGPTPYDTLGNVDFMYGSTQLPSKMIAAFSLP